ncbi:hypothetical protein LSAT2_006368 [Lamellibrachia satsuma]|nr:hypothetical protein LSAT2_006368 [Lamellibrachia satsuma]
MTGNRRNPLPATDDVRLPFALPDLSPTRGTAVRCIAWLTAGATEQWAVQSRGSTRRYRAAGSLNMTTRRLLIVSIHFFVTLDLCQPYQFIDEECMSRYNCTLKPRLPCHVKVFSECPPPTRLVHWPTKPTDVTVTEYDSVLDQRKRQCYGRENITWGTPHDGSMKDLKGFTLTITCLHGHCIGRKECVYFNLSEAVWNIRDIVGEPDSDSPPVRYSFACLRPLRGTHHIDLATLPKAHDGSNRYATTVTLPLKDCRPPSSPPPTTPSTPRPTSSTGSITTSGTGDTSTARQRPTTSDISTTTSFVSATTYVASTPVTSGEWTPTRAESKEMEETRSRQNPGVFTAVTIALGCFCGFLLSTLLLFFIYKRYRSTGRSHQNSSTVENETNNVTYNSARDAIDGRENGYTVPYSMPTLDTMLSANTERFWDVGPFKPPELVDTDTRSMTTSELDRAVRAINAEDAEQQHWANSSGYMSDCRLLAAGFRRIDETCSISGTSI